MNPYPISYWQEQEVNVLSKPRRASTVSDITSKADSITASFAAKFSFLPMSLFFPIYARL